MAAQGAEGVRRPGFAGLESGVRRVSGQVCAAPAERAFRSMSVLPDFRRAIAASAGKMEGRGSGGRFLPNAALRAGHAWMAWSRSDADCWYSAAASSQ